MFKNNKIKLLGLFFLLVFLSGCQKNNQIVVKEQQQTISQNTVIEKPSKILEKLDGFVLQEKQELSTAIIVDNFKDSMPLSGIANATVVYEAPVEGDITRFLMVFQVNSLPDKVGPVRSARQYFLDWADEYQALFIHAGGSPEALLNIKKNVHSIHSLDEISNNGTYFWRDWQRQEPHNLYISANSIENFIKNKNIDSNIKQEFLFWKFNDNLKPEVIEQDFFYDSNESSYALRIDYKDSIVWEFDNKNKTYLRYQDNDVFLDDKAEQVSAKNIIVQKTDISVIDEIGRKKIRTQGTGDAIIFQHNNIIEAIWKKEGTLDRTRFYNKKTQEEIEFVPGLIWIEIVSDDYNIMY